MDEPTLKPKEEKEQKEEEVKLILPIAIVVGDQIYELKPLGEATKERKNSHSLIRGFFVEGQEPKRCFSSKLLALGWNELSEDMHFSNFLSTEAIEFGPEERFEREGILVERRAGENVFQEVRSKVEKLKERGEYEKARRLIRILSSADYELEMHLMLGRCYADEGKFSKAIKEFKKLIGNEDLYSLPAERGVMYALADQDKTEELADFFYDNWFVTPRPKKTNILYSEEADYDLLSSFSFILDEEKNEKALSKLADFLIQAVDNISPVQPYDERRTQEEETKSRLDELSTNLHDLAPFLRREDAENLLKKFKTRATKLRKKLEDSN